MLQRCWNHDYRSRCIYMITVVTEERREILGRLTGGEMNAAVERLPIGEIVECCWREIPQRHPAISLMEYCVMPDHFHGILFVKKPMEKPLGTVIRGFLAGVTSRVRSAQICAETERAETEPFCSGSYLTRSIWKKGFQDSILWHKGQLDNMRAYIKDNPRRLAVKRAHPDLFRIVREIPLCGIRFEGIGNHFLLDAPIRLPIQISRSISAQELHQKQQEFLLAAQHGAVLISPCISPGEKEIARAVLYAELPLVVLLENGFPEAYKPPGKYFDACSDGRLLMLSPWKYHPENCIITRSECLQLNTYAQQLSNDRL